MWPPVNGKDAKVTITRLLGKCTKQLKSWVVPLLTEEQPLPRSDRCSLSMMGKSLTIIHTNQSQGSTELLSVENMPFNELENLAALLTQYINKNNLQLTPMYWLLAPEDYQIFLIESLPVSTDEFQNALKWRIRGLINYPIEESVIDSFKLPVKKSNIDNMIAAVVTKSKSIAVMVDILKKCGANIAAIDIPELAMRNLSSQYEDDEKSTAFLYFTSQLVILNISKQKTLFFTRRLNFTNNQEHTPKDFEQLSLEILRYFDYYQSQWRHPAPSRIFVAADNRNAAEVANILSEYLLQTVQPFHLKSILGDSTQIHLVENKYLLTMGCVTKG